MLHAMAKKSELLNNVIFRNKQKLQNSVLLAVKFPHVAHAVSKYYISIHLLIYTKFLGTLLCHKILQTLFDYVTRGTGTRNL